MPRLMRVEGDQFALIEGTPAQGRRRRAKDAQPLTTAQRLGSVIKSARDIMRKDKGLNGDLDRLPMLTWIMFLKFLDDAERMREDEAALGVRCFVRRSRRRIGSGTGRRRWTD